MSQFFIKINLSADESKALDARHLVEKDRRVADCIKSVLLCNDGWSLDKISQTLRLHNDTVSRYLNDFLKSGSFAFYCPDYSKELNDEQSRDLVKHLESNAYEKVADIISYVELTYQVSYSVASMTDWLHGNKFSYKLIKDEPVKADKQAQLKLIEKYAELKEKTSEDEPIIFIGGVQSAIQNKELLAFG